MIKPNTEEVDQRDDAKEEIRSYAVGFGLSLLLTVGAFAAVLSDLPLGWKIAAICGAGLLQVAAHLRHFLHLSFSGRQSREDLLLVLFSTLLLGIMAGGTVFLMHDLSGRMHSTFGHQSDPQD